MPARTEAQDIDEGQKRTAAEVSELGVMPAVFRTPETGLGVGAVFIYTADTSQRKPSPLITGIMYTEQEQLLWAIGTKQNFDDGRFALFGFGEITKYPQKFYGIGRSTRLEDEEVFEENRYAFDLGGEMRVYQNLSLGMGYTGRQDFNKSFEAAGNLVQGKIPGSEGGHQNGMLLSMNWDTTDDLFYASTGQKITLTYTKFAEAWGSDYPFDGIKIDARDYRTLNAKTIFATHLYALSLNEEPPFYQLGQLGGNSLLRGYFKGRYRDRKMSILQSEIRWSYNQTWRFAAFAGMGNVYRDWDEFSAARLRPSYGAGIRYQITPKQKINLRLDVGLGDPEEGAQIYLYVMEAF